MTKREKEEVLLISHSVMANEKPKPRKAALNVRRPVYQQEELNAATTYHYDPDTLKQKVKKKISTCRPKACLLSSIPVLKWLPKYKWQKNFIGDLLSGITVAIMHIPQGMAYGMLGNLPPIHGIYMAFFPVLIYFIFGTSRHVSIGTFAIVCLMTGKVVTKYSPEEAVVNGTATAADGARTYNGLEVATAVTFSVFVIQILMYVCRLGIITALLSETLVNAFTSAAAFHVMASQIKDLFGLPIEKRPPLFRVVLTVYDSVVAIPQANVGAVAMSAAFMLAMAINQEILKPKLAKKTRIPFPIELVAVVLGTIISHYMDLHNKYNIAIVGDIPTGLPAPTLPAFKIIPDIILECFVITMVSYTITMSMAFIFAQQHSYEIDANQELLALGLSNCMGSFFSCMPISASLSRSMIQNTVGGVTQLASLVSCGLLLFVLLWIGPLFEKLPRCVLASIIVVALRGMIVQMRDFKKYWILDKWDALVWIVTFFTTFVVTIDIGLFVGILTSSFALLFQGYNPYNCLLGNVPETDLYLDIKRYRSAVEIPGIKIFHYTGGLNFASKGSFRSLLFKRLGFEPIKILSARQGREERGIVEEGEELLTKCIILDFSAISYTDPSAVEMLRALIRMYKKLGIELYISGCSGPVFETLDKCDKYEKKESLFIIFPTIHDAVLFAEAKVFKKMSI